MIQDILPKVLNNQYFKKNITADSTVLIYEQDNVYVMSDDDNIQFPKYSDMPTTNKIQYIYLFSVDQEMFFLGLLDDDISWKQNSMLDKLNVKGYSFENIRIFRNPQYGYLAFAGITGYQLYGWYLDNMYCGRCRETMIHSDTERMVQCPKCGNIVYPKISPAVIVGITNGNKLLMTKYANGDYKRYALVAGFTEIGESMEETVKREVMEEVGLKVKNITYYKSQPWSFTGCVLMGYFAEVDGDTTIRMDENELAVAEWFDREEVPGGEGEISLTREMMRVFREDIK
ncbi:NAD(+) diphosphatase [Anaeromicropila herbilytica]|uniref:NAD(+) diphosphatase n=1 Tax=Anaeromicropila herbilytica TaxID=2785025 RepID=A0A7R7EM76_9FIRM|nr:NAD(+) diphosphatase [Anaeromicropila herbilytica]BCN31160.1 NADH pyrophosphatase [Anaeromicropila herbilytica]